MASHTLKSLRYEGLSPVPPNLHPCFQPVFDPPIGSWKNQVCNSEVSVSVKQWDNSTSELVEL
jgi:hypothetical protein